jgi:hypothetical protein
MPMTFDGNGTITGLSAGGLPDATVTTAEIADAAITAAKMSGAQSGSAPIYGARAWVNFNGTGTVAIRASGNVSSITDNGTGDYTVNFTTALPDANYSPVVSFSAQFGVSVASGCSLFTVNSTAAESAPSTSAFRLSTRTVSGIADIAYVCVSVFR